MLEWVSEAENKVISVLSAVLKKEKDHGAQVCSHKKEVSAFSQRVISLKSLENVKRSLLLP